MVTSNNIVETNGTLRKYIDIVACMGVRVAKLDFVFYSVAAHQPTNARLRSLHLTYDSDSDGRVTWSTRSQQRNIVRLMAVAFNSSWSR